MSLENHPNFHAVKFITDISSSFYESLRGKMDMKNLPEGFSEEISSRFIKFSLEIEEVVDKYAAKI